jgi:4-aminobutyrate aminotransferase-like enzyme
VDALAVVNAALERGLVINRTSATVLRLLPPYIVTPAEIDAATDILDQAIGAVSR